jgi:hypothetical protein
VNRLDQETAKRLGPTRAVEPFKKKKKKKKKALICPYVLQICTVFHLMLLKPLITCKAICVFTTN